jgi:hypothetical protein
MTIAGAIFLLAVGAILRYATNIHIQGVSMDTVGLILMIAGGAGLILSFFQDALWSGRRREALAEEQLRDPREVREVREMPPRY